MDMMAGIQIQMSRGENATLPSMCTCSQVPLQLHSVPLLQLHYPCYSCNLSGVIKNIESKSKRIRVDLVLECTAGGNSLWRYLHCAIPVIYYRHRTTGRLPLLVCVLIVVVYTCVY